jgi:hypothetical protein
MTVLTVLFEHENTVDCGGGCPCYGEEVDMICWVVANHFFSGVLNALCGIHISSFSRFSSHCSVQRSRVDPVSVAARLPGCLGGMFDHFGKLGYVLRCH